MVAFSMPVKGSMHHQIGDRAARGIGRRDVVEEHRADDAAGTPDSCDRAEGQVPAPRLGRLRHAPRSLARRRRSCRRAAPARARGARRRRPRAPSSLRGAAPNSVSAASRSVFCADRARAATAASITVAGTPRSCASIADQRPVPFWPAVSRIMSTSGLPVCGSIAAEHLAGDLDQVGFERPVVPALEDLRHRGRRHAEAVAHDAVDLGDHLHVGIFDAVVDGLDEMAGAFRPDQGGSTARRRTWPRWR